MTENLDEKEFSHSLSRAQDGELTVAEELGLMVCIPYCMVPTL
jgi:hypothetical protein